MKIAGPESAREWLAMQVERLRGWPALPRIVFPEGDDARVRQAAEWLARDGLIAPILLSGVAEHEPRYAAIYFERRRGKGVTEGAAAETARVALYRAALMVAAGDADGFVGGAVNTTAETVRAAFQCIGPTAGVRTVSSCFLVAVHERAFGHNGLLTFSDCAIVVEPTADELADIAVGAAASTYALTGARPVVALLSFSTKGSARHASVDKVVEALSILRERAPGLNVDGELQADAAVAPVVGRFKAPGSEVAGRANTLVFPSVESGNIAVKLVERLGGAVALGPFLQGLAKPANDLSRGCSADDIYASAVVTALQSAHASI